jgi:catechol 2,3-dioxygenase-like lactoylglutathione lyase family enzyme
LTIANMRCRPVGKRQHARSTARRSGCSNCPSRWRCARGGVWFATSNLRLHLGVDATFRPGATAHIALRVGGLSALLERLAAAGHPVESADDLAGYPRCYVRDPFGNRIELLERTRLG